MLLRKYGVKQMKRGWHRTGPSPACLCHTNTANTVRAGPRQAGPRPKYPRRSDTCGDTCGEKANPGHLRGGNRLLHRCWTHLCGRSRFYWSGELPDYFTGVALHPSSCTERVTPWKIPVTVFKPRFPSFHCEKCGFEAE